MQWRLLTQIKSSGMVILTKGTGGVYYVFLSKNLFWLPFHTEKKIRHHPYYSTTHPKNNPMILTVFPKTFLTKSCKCPLQKGGKKVTEVEGEKALCLPNVGIN